MRAADLLAWLDDATPRAAGAARREWRTGAAAGRGWRRIETVPDDVVRGLVRSGALALKEAAEREGVPGAQPRAEVADALLDSVVLTVTDDDRRAAPRSPLRALSALTRMGFLPRGGAAHVDVAGRWVRVVARVRHRLPRTPGRSLVLRLKPEPRPQLVVTQ